MPCRNFAVVALFGPNASGKSNVLRALSFLGWFARDLGYRDEAIEVFIGDISNTISAQNKQASTGETG